MNKRNAVLIIAFSLCMAAGKSFAAFSSVSRSTVTACITFTRSVPVNPALLEANYILSCQIAEDSFGADDRGCINDVVPTDGPTWVVPRENGTAILGLIEAFRITSRTEFKEGALACADYLKRRQEADGAWCRKYDERYDVRISSEMNKSPSEAGSVIMAMYRIMKMGWEDDQHQYYISVSSAARFIIDCIDRKRGDINGLAGAGKEYGSYENADDLGSYQWSDWSWTPDNCYAYIGLMCMREWAVMKGDYAFAKTCHEHAQGILNGINICLKNPSSSVWYRVVGGNGLPVNPDSYKIDALCYYPQKYDLPVPQYGSDAIAQWMIDNLQVTGGTVSEGFGAFVWGEVDNVADHNDRRSQGFSEEAWLALRDIPGQTALTARNRAKEWWESDDNTGGHGGQLWDTVNGGIRDWYDITDASTPLAPDWQKFIDTSANCIFVYAGGYDHMMGISTVADNDGPLISHRAIDRVSPLASVITATGTVSDSTGVNIVEMDYYFDVSTPVVTAAKAFTGENNACFRFEISCDTASARQFFYRLRAVDVLGNSTLWPSSAAFHAARIDFVSAGNIGAAGGTVTVSDADPDSGEMKLIIPAGALNEDVTITVTEIDPSDPSVPKALAPSAPLSVFRFAPEGLVFNKVATLIMPYTDADNDGIVDGTSDRAQDLAIMWWDGFTWNLVGGSVDLVAHTVSWEIKHFSLYALFAVPSFTDNDYRPRERIITPARVDGVNDVARFNGLVSGDTVRIFDVTGHLVREMRNDFEWDGRDDDNHIVESGIYIYQIKTAGKTISGTIAVAK